MCLLRLERLDHLARKFKHKCDIHEEWSYGKEELLQAQDFKKCRLNELKVSDFDFMRSITTWELTAHTKSVLLGIYIWLLVLWL